MLGPQKNARYHGFEGRINLVSIVCALAFALLVLRLWELQIARWGEFRGKSDNNRLRIQRLESPRGTIIGNDGDNDNVILVDNRAAGDLMFVLADCDIDPEIVCQRLAELVDVNVDVLRDEVRKSEESKQPHRQILVKEDLPRSLLARVDEYSYALPGVFTLVRPHRRYPFGKTAGQLLGYLGEINSAELEERRPDYRMGDYIGRSGLERTYEKVLHGKDGQMLVTKYAAGEPQLRTDAYGNPYIDVDSFGHRLVEEQIQEPVPGKTLFVTLDIGLQAQVEALLEGHAGAVVVLNADTGAILAIASNPSYDPSIFVTAGMGRLRNEALRNKPNRMIHRAYQEVYAPGSIFKLVLAAAALEEGIIDDKTKFYCSGKFTITPNGRAWNCWKRHGHGEVDIVDAIAFSCDVFFYRVGLRLGVDGINKWAPLLGLGIPTGIDLPGETKGLIPSPEWKAALMRKISPEDPYEQRWYPGDTVNMSIGQGAVTVTPLQAAVLMATFVNGGHRVRPFLNRQIGPALFGPYFSEDTLGLILRGTKKCVEKGPPAPTGTGKAAKVEGITIIGKTGSAQTVSLSTYEKYENEEDIPVHLRDHAWFIAGVLDREPRIAMSILVEHGHHGSTVAAPLAKKIIEYFYRDRAAAPIAVAKTKT